MALNEPPPVDAILIGAGHNSLACGLHLAAKGWRVRVIERADAPGGAVKSGEYTLAGFRHDWAAMNLTGFAGSRFYQAYREELESHGLGFARSDECYASVFDGGHWLGVRRGADRLDGSADKVDPDELGAARAEFARVVPMLRHMLTRPARLRVLFRVALMAVRRLGPGGAIEFFRLLLMSPRHWLNNRFSSDEVKALFAVWGMHFDLTPDVPGGTIVPLVQGFSPALSGVAIGAGGADTVIRAMTGALRARGGEVICGAEVTRIVHENGRARGVELADGSRHMARRAVIANVTPGALLRLTGGTGRGRQDWQLRGFSHAPGTMMIHLALTDAPGWAGGAELRRYPYIHIGPNLDYIARAYGQALAGLLPEAPVVVVGQPCALDPSRAPDGRHVLWLQVRMVPALIAGDAAGEIAGRDWESARDAYAKRVIDLVARYAPGLNDLVLARRVVTPVELEADNPNLVGGDQGSGSMHLAQNHVFRPAFGMAHGPTAIKRLFHIGASSWPGAGVTANSGYNLARMLAGK